MLLRDYNNLYDFHFTTTSLIFFLIIKHYIIVFFNTFKPFIWLNKLTKRTVCAPNIRPVGNNTINLVKFIKIYTKVVIQRVSRNQTSWF